MNEDEREQGEEAFWCCRCGCTVDAALVEDTGHRHWRMEVTIDADGVRDPRVTVEGWCPGPVEGLS